MEETELPDICIVVRAGVMSRERLESSAEVNRGICGVYALSVWATPGLTAREIALEAKAEGERIGEVHMPHGKLQTATVGGIRQFGYKLVQTGPRGHYSLMLPNPPTDADWDNLMSVFSEPEDNPAARKRRNA